MLISHAYNKLGKRAATLDALSIRETDSAHNAHRSRVRAAYRDGGKRKLASRGSYSARARFMPAVCDRAHIPARSTEGDGVGGNVEQPSWRWNICLSTLGVS